MRRELKQRITRQACIQNGGTASDSSVRLVVGRVLRTQRLLAMERNGYCSGRLTRREAELSQRIVSLKSRRQEVSQMPWRVFWLSIHPATSHLSFSKVILMAAKRGKL